jgi:DNA mismatch repair protein MutS2
MEDLTGLDWSELIERLAQLASSHGAKENILRLSPYKNQNLAIESGARTLLYSRVLTAGVRPTMESLDLFQTWHSRLLRKATLTRIELKDVRKFCQDAIYFRKCAAEAELSLPSLSKPEEPLSAIDQILTADGDIRPDASETLFRLFQEKSAQTKHIERTIEGLVHHHQIEELLQEKFVTTREGRWVLPVKSGSRHGIEGVIHGSSQSKQTVFMEPASLVPLNNRLRQIEVEIEDEIDRLLRELSMYLQGQAPDLQTWQRVLLDADETLAKAELSLKIKGTLFEFSEGEMSLAELRHPLLTLNGVEVVPNSVTMDLGERILLLSGPNAGGKTVLLKSVGLATHMARCGLPIAAAPRSKVPFLSRLMVAVGDQQSVDANLSTFAAHLRRLNEGLSMSGPGHLILIDEICGSTDPEEGAALARSFIESYLDQDVFAVITSHLSALKGGWTQNGLVHGSLEFHKTDGPTYRLIKGVPGQSLAIQTARRAGVVESVLHRAMELLSPELRRYQNVLTEVEELQEKLHRLMTETASEKSLLAEARKDFETKSAALERDRDKLIQKAVEKTRHDIDQLVREAQVKGLFQKHSEAEKVKLSLPEVLKKSPTPTGATAGSRLPQTLLTAEDFAARFPPGAKVYVESLHADGIVQGSPNAKGEVPILSRSMRVTVPWTQLVAKAHDPQGSATASRSRGSAGSSGSPSADDAMVDLRGQTSEEAIASVEIALDQGALAGLDRLKIVHGHGTEVLKRSVRSYLSRSVYVKRWWAGTKDSGGDGVTWVELD